MSSNLMNSRLINFFFVFLRIPLCNLINQYLSILAKKFPSVKFIKSISTTCIPNYPDNNLPTIFVYYEGELKNQIVGPNEFNGTKLKIDELELKLHRFGAVKSTLTAVENEDESSNRLKSCENEMIRSIRQSILNKNDDYSDDD